MTKLFKRHFQVAYVAEDAKAAIASLRLRFDIAHWDVLDMKVIHGPEAPARYIANAWVGDIMIEVIEPDEVIDSIYRDWKSDSAAALRFHHLGFLVDTAEELDVAKAQFAGQGFPIVAEGSFGNVLDYAYADTTAELGHYYEMMFLKAEGEGFFEQIPNN